MEICNVANREAWHVRFHHQRYGFQGDQLDERFADQDSGDEGGVCTDRFDSSTWEAPATTPTKPAAPKTEAPSPRDSSLADAIIATGEKYLGTPYKFGANYARDRAFDCSEYTRVVFGENGITLPRSSRQQAQVGRTVSLNALQKGDLIFFDTSSARAGIDHVAIYAGNGKILHAIPRGGVRYDSFSGYWVRAAVTAKRVIE